MDLDNTLWGGIVGEDGFNGIKLGGNPIGKAFVELLAAKLQVTEDKIAKTTVADFFGQILAEKPDHAFPASAKKLATELKASLNLE